MRSAEVNLCFVGWDWMGGGSVNKPCEYCGTYPTHTLAAMVAVSSSSSDLSISRVVNACNIDHAERATTGQWDDILSMGWVTCNACGGAG